MKTDSRQNNDFKTGISNHEVFLLIDKILSQSNVYRLGEKIKQLIVNLDGMDQIIESDEKTHNEEIQTIITQSKLWPLTTRPYWIKREISQLSIFFYRTKNSVQQWNPLMQPYLEFIAQSDSIDTWIDETPFPTPEDVSIWLKS